MTRRHIIEPFTAPVAGETIIWTERPAQEGDHLIAGESLPYTKAVVANPRCDPVLGSPLDGRLGYVSVGNILKIGDCLCNNRLDTYQQPHQQPNSHHQTPSLWPQGLHNASICSNTIKASYPQMPIQKTSRISGTPTDPGVARAAIEKPNKPTPTPLWLANTERHEAFSDRAVVKGHRLVLVAASMLKLGAA